MSAETVPAALQTRRAGSASVRKALRTVIIAVIALLWILPVIWVVLGSLRPNVELIGTFNSGLSWSLLWPSEFTFENYRNLFVVRGFASGMLNSLLVTGASVVFGLLIASCAAYALSVFRFRGREALFAVIVISFMIPFEAIAIPLSQQFTDWSLNNSYIGLTLPGIADGMAIFYLRQAFLSVPPSYREAAQIDGASELRVLFSVFAPMNLGPLVNAAFLIFIGQWSAYIWPLLVVTDDSHQLAPVLLARTFGQYGANYAENFAGAVLLLLIPAIGIFLMQRYLGRVAALASEK